MKGITIVMNLQAVFDDSGKSADPNTTYVLLCGYLGYQWEGFIHAWKTLLAKKGIPAVHMNRLMRDQEIKKLGWTREGRDVVIREFIHIIRTHLERGIVFVVDAAHWRQMDTFIEARKTYPGVKERIASISFVDDEIYEPAQAADLLAWLINKHMRETDDWRDVPFLKQLGVAESADTTYPELTYSGFFFSKERLEEFYQMEQKERARGLSR